MVYCIAVLLATPGAIDQISGKSQFPEGKHLNLVFWEGEAGRKAPHSFIVHRRGGGGGWGMEMGEELVACIGGSDFQAF